MKNHFIESERMKANQRNGRLRRLALSGAALLIAGAMIVPGVAKGQSAADIGVSHPPLVTIIFDSSSSMQWSEKGHGHYPEREYSTGTPASHLDTWKTGTHLCLPGSRYQRGTSGDAGCLGSAEFDGNKIPSEAAKLQEAGVVPVETVGPCMVWHPRSEGGAPYCGNNYHRPTSCADSDTLCHPGGPTPDYPSASWVSNRLTTIRNDAGMRLVDAETPRHIQVKQILTGDMIMEYQGEGEKAVTKAGPGCWFVPRGRGTSNEQICCSEVDQFGLCRDGTGQGFDSFIDHEEPIPHFQEIYDYQENNGLLQAMARTAFFSVVMFDSYRGDATGGTHGWQFPMNDIIAGPSISYGDRLPHDVGGAAREGANCGEGSDNAPCYDLGLFRFVGPRSFDMDDDERVLLSGYVQDAIRNAGHLENGDPLSSPRLTGERLDEDGRTVEINVFDYPLSKQPFANASPFAAVFHDLHQFFLHGQQDENAAFLANPQEGINPFADDRFKACRARHVVMFTDGIPEPEAGEGFGSDSLSLAYGYDKSRYPYLVTEDAIEEMILASIAQMEDDLPGDATIDPRFIPRVHVLAVNQADEEEKYRNDIIDKIAKMAARGRTCAQYYLPPEMVPLDVETGHVDANGVRMKGKCDITKEDSVCLVEQTVGSSAGEPGSGYLYEPPDGSAPFRCDHPALLLTKNDRDTMVKAFQMIFNEIASDLVTRTKPSVTNYLDYDDKAGQYRLFSGVKIGGNIHWKGLLNRQLLECGFDENGATVSVTEMRPLHDDINRLRLELTEADDGLVDGGPIFGVGEDVDVDRRRIFTSFPSYLWGADKAELSNAPVAEDFFHFTFALNGVETDVTDEFSETFNLPGYSSMPSSGNSRVPFKEVAMGNTLTNAGTEAGELVRYLGLRSSETEEVVAELKKVVDRYRGRLGVLADRMLGGIYNSNPVTIGPPDLDLPIDSYRDFRRAYQDRPAMTYVGTVDGLLHAIYAGEPEVLLRDLDGKDSKVGKARLQREAWAYIPQLLHQELASKVDGAHQLLDGSPVVTDIRLCNDLPDSNTNLLACPSNSGGEESGVPVASQWRTVLVQGMGTSPGYFALDVTRPGDRTTPPDPMVLWEFGPRWEEMQLQKMKGSEQERIGPKSGSENDYLERISDACKDAEKTMPACMPFEPNCNQFENLALNDLWELSYLGVSVAEPAIGTVPMRVSSDDKVRPLQRAVAIFGGGSPAGTKARVEKCTDDITGKAIYVVDLQSGEIIRRFIQYEDGNESKGFDSPITGTPVMSAATPGESSTRAFIGDNRGRLYRIDMTSLHPAEWKVTLFFNPENPPVQGFITGLGDESGAQPQFGPASFPPAVTTNRKRNLVIAYGLGHRGDTGGEDTVQAIIALEEERTTVENSHKAGDATPVWRMYFDDGERLTGAPVAFDNDFFFTTYVENQAHACLAGKSRIYRLSHHKNEDGEGNEGERWEPRGAWPESLQSDPGNFEVEEGENPRWFGPTDPTMIRGLTITMGPLCVDVVEDDTGTSVEEAPPQKPQLIAQAGTANVGDGGTGTGGGSDPAGVGSGMSRIAMELETPRTRALPMTWMVIGN